MHLAKQYIEDVLNDKIVVCEYVKLAVKRHVKDLKEGHKRGLYFDEEAANKMIAFAEMCYHHRGTYAGQPIRLAPWQQFIYWVSFGWKREDGTRRFRTSYVEVARKNAKTTTKALEALYGITVEKENGAQVYVGATKEEQARILVNDAGQIALKTPYLKNKVKTFKFKELINRVVYTPNNSFIAPVGRDSNTHDGFDPSMGIMDEYHAHPTDYTKNVIESGMGARRQPMMSIITTAGFNRTVPCYQLRETYINLLRGNLTDDSVFAIIYTLDEDDDWEDEKNWPKANPNLITGEDVPYHLSVKMDFLRDRFTSAKNEGSSKEVDFKTKNLNVWTDAAKTWIQDSVWKKNYRNLALEDLKHVKCYGGLDLASVSDFTSLVLNFDMEDGTHFQYPIFWLPEETVKTAKHRQNYQQWIKDGWMLETPGNTTDYNYVKKFIFDLREKLPNLQSIAYDPHNSSQLVVDIVTELGEDFMTKFAQFVSVISHPTKEFERMNMNGTMLNNGNPVMAWMMSNVTLYHGPDAKIKIAKDKSSDKVDGPVAGVMAYGEYLTKYADKTGPSIYESRGIITL